MGLFYFTKTKYNKKCLSTFVILTHINDIWVQIIPITSKRSYAFMYVHRVYSFLCDKIKNIYYNNIYTLRRPRPSDGLLRQ